MGSFCESIRMEQSRKGILSQLEASRNGVFGLTVFAIPYTFSIHPITGRILVNDVGQVTWEEVNDATGAGRNFGWPATEGVFNAATYPAYTKPIYSYAHATGDGTGCAITGGVFFYPTTTNYPSSYFDQYFIQDLCGSWINVLDVSSGAVRSSFATAIPGNALALTTGPDGNLYFLSRSSNAVYKVVFSDATAPYIILDPQPTTVAEGHAFTLSVGAAGTTPLLYQWFRNGIAIVGAVSSVLTVPEAGLEDAGQYTVQVSNSNGNATSAAVAVTVIANKPPVASIQTPATGTFYRAGEAINFSGTATDAEDGVLPHASLQWNINFHHDTHKHDEPPIIGVPDGSFMVPAEGETSPNVWYRIILTATDANGLTGKDSVDVRPLTSIITLSTDPEGLELTLDGQPVVTPFVFTSVEGLLRAIGAPTPQQGELVFCTFYSWSDGETQSERTIATPAEDFNYVARFQSVVSIEDPFDQLVAFPNPSRNGVVYLRGSWHPPVTISMGDILGREVACATWTDTRGDEEQPFVFGKVKSGIYSLIIEQEGSRRVLRIQVYD